MSRQGGKTGIFQMYVQLSHHKCQESPSKLTTYYQKCHIGVNHVNRSNLGSCNGALLPTFFFFNYALCLFAHYPGSISEYQQYCSEHRAQQQCLLGVYQGYGLWDINNAQASRYDGQQILRISTVKSMAACQIVLCSTSPFPSLFQPRSTEYIAQKQSTIILQDPALHTPYPHHTVTCQGALLDWASRRTAGAGVEL